MRIPGNFYRGRFGKARMAFAGLLVVIGMVWGVTSALAVHDNGMFELDGNTARVGAPPPYDWNNLFDASGNRLITPDPVNGPILASTFVKDSAEPDQSYFQSDKDIYPIASGAQHWSCGPINNPLDKDNILNAYAALIQVPNNAPDNAGHQVLYLASERGSNNGTSFAGFWLLKDKTVGCSGTNNFSGHHTDGDLLVVSDYTNGGGTQDVTVYRWTGDDANGTLVQVPGLSGSVCGTVAGNPNDNACAIANSATITTPWSPTSHASNTFVEAGIDLTALLGANGGCFTNFLAETRSSNQLTATLKDFAGGQFNTCVPPAITTTATPGGAANPPGVATQHDVANIATAGSRPAPTGTISFFLCNPSQITAAGCPSGGTQVGGAVTIAAGSATSANAGAALTTTAGKYCWRAEYTPDAAGSNFYVASSHTDASNECFTVIHGTPTIDTQIAVTGKNNPSLGYTTLGDTATLSGFVSTVTGETITFSLYGPYANGVNPTCTGNPAFTTTGTLNAAGQATTSQTFTPTSAGTYVWVASYAKQDLFNDAVTGKCTDAHESVNVLAPSLSVTKTADADPVSAGDPIGFTIHVANAGPGTANDVTLKDPLPTGTTAAGWNLDSSTIAAPGSCAVNGAIGNQELDCSAVDLASGASYDVHISAATDFNHCTLYDNTATASASNSADKTGHDSIQCLKPNLSVTKTADAKTVDAGDPIGFTVHVANAGPGVAEAVTLNDPLPAGTTSAGWKLDSSTIAAPGSCSVTGAVGNQTLACTAVDLASGTSYDVHISAKTNFDNCTKYDNTATAKATNAPDATGKDSIQCNKPSLTVVKKADAGTVDAGDPIGFKITVANGGPGTAKSVTLADPLPKGATVGGWNLDSSTIPAPGSCSITGAIGNQELDCTAVDLGAKTSYDVHISAATDFNNCARYDNTATASASNAPDATGKDSITCNKPSLTVTKTADNSVVNAGDPIGFTIHVANAGPGTAKGVTLADPLPGGTTAGWTIDNNTIPAPGSCQIKAVAAGHELDCTAVDLGAGDSYDVHISAGTDKANCTKYDNTATASSTNAPDARGSDSITCLKPGLNVIKTADNGTVDAGDPIGFTITVGNGGPGTAMGVTLKDPLPGGTSAGWAIDNSTIPAPGTCTINAVPAGQELDCTAVDLTALAGYDVHISAGTDFNNCTKYDNTATASASNSPDATGSDSIQCNAPSLTTTKTADNATVNAGDPIGFTIHVANGGPGTAKAVTLKDPLPAGTTAAGWTLDNTTIPAPGACTINAVPAGQELDCTAVDLKSGDSYDVHVSAATDFANCTKYDNTATASASNSPDATGSDSVQCNKGLVSITKTADHSAPVNAGSTIGFTVEVKNTGAGDVSGVKLADALPAGTGSGVTWAIDQTVGAPAQFVLAGAKGAQTLSLASGTLPAGADYKVHVTAATSQTECSVYDNTATLTTRTANNPNPASAHESCAYHVDLAVTKAGAPAVQDLGQGNITWTMVVKNNGPDTDTGVKIADPMPSGNTFVSATSTQGTCTGGAILNCNIGTMAAGATVTITLVTTPTIAGTQTNTVTVVGDRPETNTANNQATATVQVNTLTPPPPVYCVAVSKITPHQLFVGRKTTLTIRLTKHGKAAAGVRVLIKGPKLHVKTKPSNSRGVIKQVVKMKKAGIDTFIPLASKHCNTKRVGVTGVFTPPVTG